MKELISPKQVARAIHVSESSVKRWCDDGRLRTERTVGGHRRIHVSEVLRFIRASGHRLVAPDVLGIPASAGPSRRALERAPAKLLESLISGSAEGCREVIFDLFVSGHTLATIGDQVIRLAFEQIGDGWACGSLEVYKERRACELTVRVLREVETLLAPSVESAPLAIGGTPEHDFYTIPTLLVELVLRQMGCRVVQLGSSLPVQTVLTATETLQPDLIWLSVSEIADEAEFLRGCEQISQTTSASRAFVLGGHALAIRPCFDPTPGIYVDNLQQLVNYAESRWSR